MGQKWAQKIQLGKETTPGTAVAATTVWRGVGGMLTDDREVVMVDEQIGIALPTTRNYIPMLSGSLSMAETPATFEQLPHILEAGVKAIGTGAADGVGTGKVYNYTMGTTAVNTIKTYTLETGDNQQAEEMEYAFVESFTLSAERGALPADVAAALRATSMPELSLSARSSSSRSGLWNWTRSSTSLPLAVSATSW